MILESGSPVLRVEQTLINESRESIDCVWGEHIALGEPFLNDKCVVDLPGGTIINHPVDTHPNNRLLAGFESSWPLTKLSTGEDHYLSKIPAKDFNSYDMSYVFDMPEEYFTLEKLQKSVQVDRRLSLKELLERAFDLIPHFKSNLYDMFENM